MEVILRTEGDYIDLPIGVLVRAKREALRDSEPVELQWCDAHDRVVFRATVSFDDVAGLMTIKHRYAEQTFEQFPGGGRLPLKCPASGEPVSWLQLERELFRTEAMMTPGWTPTAQREPPSPTDGRWRLPGTDHRFDASDRKWALTVYKHSWTTEQRDNYHRGRKLKQAQRRRLRQNAFSTEEALARGRPLLRSLDKAEATDRLLGALAEINILTGLRALPTAAPLQIWEDCCRIDIRVLAQAGCLKPGACTLAILEWSDLGDAPDSVIVLFDLRDDELNYMVLEWCMPTGLVYQQIWLEPPEEGRRRWAMLCPVKGEPVEVVAYREGHFASRQVQRLVNRSQRAMKPARAKP